MLAVILCSGTSDIEPSLTIWCAVTDDKICFLSFEMSDDLMGCF